MSSSPPQRFVFKTQWEKIELFMSLFFQYGKKREDMIYWIWLVLMFTMKFLPQDIDLHLGTDEIYKIFTEYFAQGKINIILLLLPN